MLIIALVSKVRILRKLSSAMPSQACISLMSPGMETPADCRSEGLHNKRCALSGEDLVCLNKTRAKQ